MKLHLDFRGKIFKYFILSFRFAWFNLGYCSSFFLVFFVCLFLPLFSSINYTDGGFQLSRFFILTHCYRSSSRIKTTNSPSFWSLGEKDGFLGCLCFLQIRFYFLQLFLEMPILLPYHNALLSVFSYEFEALYISWYL